MRLIKYCLVAILVVLGCSFAKADGGYNIKVHIDGRLASSNADVMLDEEGNVVTSHSTNPVPLIYVDKNIIGKGYSLHEGALCDLAPTLLQLMELPVPAEMEGKCLID